MRPRRPAGSSLDGGVLSSNGSCRSGDSDPHEVALNVPAQSIGSLAELIGLHRYDSVERRTYKSVFRNREEIFADFGALSERVYWPVTTLWYFRPAGE